MRAALLGVIEKYTNSAAREFATLGHAGDDEEVKKCRGEASVTDWIERSFSDEIEMVKSDQHTDETFIGLTGLAEAVAEAKDQFFADLPSGRLSSEEEALRKSLFKFVDQCPVHLAKLSKAKNDPLVKERRKTLLPNGSVVTFAEWIEKRVGDDFLLTKNPPHDRTNGRASFILRADKTSRAVKRPRTDSSRREDRRSSPPAKRRSAEGSRAQGSHAYSDRRRENEASKRSRKPEALGELIEESLRYLERKVGFGRPVDRRKVSRMAAGIEKQELSQVFQHLLEARKRLEDPTAAICKALESVIKDESPPWRR